MFIFSRSLFVPFIFSFIASDATVPARLAVMHRFLTVLACVGVATAAQTQLVQLDAYADDSIRIRVAPAGGSITEPPLQVRFCAFVYFCSQSICSTVNSTRIEFTYVHLIFSDRKTAQPQALIGTPPMSNTAVSGDGKGTLSNGNLKITVDPTTAFVTATRISDGKVLLQYANNFSSFAGFAVPHCCCCLERL
jgi:hypothetical protein